MLTVEGRAKQLLEQNEALMLQLEGIADRDIHKSLSLREWEFNKMVAYLNDDRSHEMPMTDSANRALPYIAQLSFNDQKAPRFRTFGGCETAYKVIGKAFKAAKNWKLIDTRQIRNDTGNMIEFILIESPAGQQFQVGWDVVVLKDGAGKRFTLSGSITHYIYMMNGGKTPRLHPFAGNLGKPARFYSQTFPNALPHSPYHGYRAPHMIALIALFLTGQTINVIDKKDIQAARTRISIHAL